MEVGIQTASTAVENNSGVAFGKWVAKEVLDVLAKKAVQDPKGTTRVLKVAKDLVQAAINTGGPTPPKDPDQDPEKGKEEKKHTEQQGKTEKWTRDPSSIQDKMALESAKKGQGVKIIDKLNDPKFKGMEKWEFRIKSNEGKDSVIHYVRDPKSGKLTDFKFKKNSLG